VHQTRWIIDRQLQGLHDRKVADLRVEDLDRFYAALRERGGRNGGPLAGSTVARTHTVIRLALAQAVVWGWRADNPTERAHPGRYDAPEIRPPSPDEVRRLFDAALEKDLELLTLVALRRRPALAEVNWPRCGSVTSPRAACRSRGRW
jgi:site-specific recombinase XerD